MMEKPLVSIITPAYNCSSTIKDTFDSIAKQSFKNWEWIVIDDCSDDETPIVVNELSLKDERVVFLKTQKNSGAAVARNIGIQFANGRYIAFLDSDDVWTKDKLEKQLAFIINNNYGFICSNYKVSRNGKKDVYYNPKKKIITYKDLLKTCSIGCLTVMYDSQKVGKILMPTDAPKREDHATWIDITKKGFNCYRISECLATYNLRDNTVSSNKLKMFKYQYKMYRTHLSFSPIKSLFYTCIVSFNKVFRKYR